MESELFFSFEEFKRELQSWEKPLGKFLDGKIFQDIYKYVKAEYESGKKVKSKRYRSTLKRKISSMLLRFHPLVLSRLL